MITAQDAKNLSYNARLDKYGKYIAAIEHRIKAAARAGEYIVKSPNISSIEYGIVYDLNPARESYKTVKEYFTSLGFTWVEGTTGSCSLIW